MRVGKKAFACRIYSHFTQQCRVKVSSSFLFDLNPIPTGTGLISPLIVYLLTTPGRNREAEGCCIHTIDQSQFWSRYTTRKSTQQLGKKMSLKCCYCCCYCCCCCCCCLCCGKQFLAQEFRPPSPSKLCKVL